MIELDSWKIHEGAILMEKRTGEVYVLTGRVSLWDPHKLLLSKLDDHLAGLGRDKFIVVGPEEHKRFMTLDPGRHPLEGAFPSRHR